MQLPTTKMLDLNLAHFDYGWEDFLDGQGAACGDPSSTERCLTVCGNITSGWHIQVNDELAATYLAEATECLDPGSLPELMRLALSEGCAWLAISDTGPIVADLPTFQTEEE